MAIFDYNKLYLHKQKAATRRGYKNYLASSLEKDILDKLSLICPQKISSVLILGYMSDYWQKFLTTRPTIKIKFYHPLIDKNFLAKHELPFAHQSFDLIVDNLIFHWINEPLLYLANIYQLLNNKGLYISGFLGNQTLSELRDVLIKTDLEIFKGVSNHISPMLNTETVTQILQNTSLKNNIIDCKKTMGKYSNMNDLIKDLRNMGENNCLLNAIAINNKQYSKIATKIYHNLYLLDNSIKATFDLMFMFCWK